MGVQASLKNYLRAVLAIQHGLTRGSIPVWWPSDVKPSKTVAMTTVKAASRRELLQSEATGRMALSV